MTPDAQTVAPEIIHFEDDAASRALPWNRGAQRSKDSTHLHFWLCIDCLKLVVCFGVLPGCPAQLLHRRVGTSTIGLHQHFPCSICLLCSRECRPRASEELHECQAVRAL